MQCSSLAVLIEDFAQVDCATVSKLSSPVAELMTAVAHGERVHAVQQAILGKDADEIVGLERIDVQVQQIGNLPRVSNQSRPSDRRRQDTRETGLPYLPTKVLRLRVCGQLARKTIVEGHRLQST